MAQVRQKDLVLILAREFASKLAMAMLITDADGNLVYYNESAEKILGRPFAEARELPASEWASRFRVEDVNGEQLPLEEMPAGAALIRRQPAHRTIRITALDNVTRTISVTGLPLFARSDDFVGVVAIFWENGDQ